MTGKDQPLHPPLPPVCARISNPTTWPHVHPSTIWSITYVYAATVTVHQIPNIQELCPMSCGIQKKSRKKKKLKGSFKESTDDSLLMEEKDGNLY